MKELLTLKEAAALAGRTTKTIKNYIKHGKIRNFFLVEGKYGQEYRISLKDVEPLMKRAGGKAPGKKGDYSPGKNQETAEQSGTGRGGKAPEAVFEQPEYQFLLRRNDEILMELGRCREKAEKLDRSILKLRQELEEKNMLIALLMKKGGQG